jgi:putative transposase
MGVVVELTDDEWSLVEDLFDPPVHRGVKGTIPRRDIVSAILWIARTGCQWRYLPDRFPDWQAVWSQWRRWRDKGVWATAMRRLATRIRQRHGCNADPSMVMIDGQTVKGGRAGPIFHESGGRGGRGGRTRGAKRTILIEILGLPLAVQVDSAKPHDVQAARKFLAPQLDPKHPALPGLQAIVADRGYTGLGALAASHGLVLDIKRPPTPALLPPKKPGGKPRRAPRVFTPLRPLYKVENTWARLGMWRRLSLLRGDTARGEDLARGSVRRLPVREAAGRADLTVPGVSRCATASSTEAPSDRQRHRQS